MVNRMKTVFAQQSIFATPSAIEVRISEENTPNATTQEFIPAKISGCALKQGSKTYSSLRQSNLQLQNQAALMSRRIRVYRCAADWLAHSPVCKIESCYATQELRIRIKYARKLPFFLLRVEVQQAFSFPFSLLRHNQMPECFYFNNCCV